MHKANFRKRWKAQGPRRLWRELEWRRDEEENEEWGVCTYTCVSVEVWWAADHEEKHILDVSSSGVDARLLMTWRGPRSHVSYMHLAYSVESCRWSHVGKELESYPSQSNIQWVNFYLLHLCFRATILEQAWSEYLSSLQFRWKHLNLLLISQCAPYMSIKLFESYKYCKSSPLNISQHPPT